MMLPVFLIQCTVQTTAVGATKDTVEREVLPGISNTNVDTKSVSNVSNVEDVSGGNEISRHIMLLNIN